MASAIDKTFLSIVYLGMLVRFTANEYYQFSCNTTI